MHTSQIKTVTAHDLCDANIIYQHDALFRLRDRLVILDRDDNGGGNIISFHVDVLEPGDIIPKWWLQDWIVQGNSRAQFARVTDTEILTKYACRLVVGQPVICNGYDGTVAALRDGQLADPEQGGHDLAAALRANQSNQTRV